MLLCGKWKAHSGLLAPAWLLWQYIQFDSIFNVLLEGSIFTEMNTQAFSVRLTNKTSAGLQISSVYNNAFDGRTASYQICLHWRPFYCFSAIHKHFQDFAGRLYFQVHLVLATDERWEWVTSLSTSLIRIKTEERAKNRSLVYSTNYRAFFWQSPISCYCRSSWCGEVVQP